MNKNKNICSQTINNKSITIKAENLPLITVFLSIVAIYLSIIFKIPLTLVTWILLIPVFILIMYFRKFKLFDTFSNIALIIIILLFITTQLLGRNFMILDCGITFLSCTILFSKCFKNHQTLSKSFHILRKTYQFFILLIFIEIFCIFLGFSPVFSMIKGYHLGNRADIISYFKIFEEYNAPDTIFLGRQIAGMLALNGGIIFYYSNFTKKYLWVALSIFIFIFTATGIMLVISILILLISVFVIKNEKKRTSSDILKKIIYFLCFIFIGILAYDFVLNSFFSRALSTDTVVSGLDLDDPGAGLSNREYYLFAFSLPIYQLYGQSLISILIGAPTNYLLNPNIFFAGDFGFGFNLLRGGVIIGFLFLFYFLKYISLGIKYIKKYTIEIDSTNELKSLILVNLIYLISQAHYISVQATIFHAFQFSILVHTLNFLKKN